jgi:hypothetical protein
MTLVAELRDSATGDIIMRIFDRTWRTSRRAQRNTASTTAEARSAAIGWAKALRNELDLAGLQARSVAKAMRLAPTYGYPQA